ncbi:unnamed protein product [Citrullus colocynthis]|uniref:Secreted protein n=1 Tax=Citrullus colocynthis TaxID=252529 RepID=A0ABP0YCK0_9ROSI
MVGSLFEVLLPLGRGLCFRKEVFTTVALVVHAMTALVSPSTQWVSQLKDSLALSYDAAWLREPCKCWSWEVVNVWGSPSFCL